MDIQVGDRVIYKYKGGTGFNYQIIVDNDAQIEDFKQQKDLEILKIERSKYEVIEEKKEILDKREREYIWNIIKPFKDRVIGILKVGYKEKQYIVIRMNYDSNINLPYFKKDTMYRGMKLDKEYTLEELGLGGE